MNTSSPLFLKSVGNLIAVIVFPIACLFWFAQCLAAKRSGTAIGFFLFAAAGVVEISMIAMRPSHPDIISLRMSMACGVLYAATLALSFIYKGTVERSSSSPSFFAVLKSIILLALYPVLAFRQSRTGARSAAEAMHVYALGCTMAIVFAAAVLSAANIGHKPESERWVNTAVLLVIYTLGGLRTLMLIHEPRHEPPESRPQIH